ncbi:hypothetical protein BGZ96_005616 [Linnemannia gamsii]|uniref:Uncharacterized protein n=1 Tax=Linnemannia gamsii TaxID=64522 RepID=A0ABQ7K3S5_9FUNG|nr:hypothetical protein BGZ96_005616 [Linnemannia gamsii]
MAPFHSRSNSRFGLRSLLALLVLAAIQFTCFAGQAVKDTYGNQLQENEPYYICTAWLRESTKEWEFFGMDSKLEREGLSWVGYPQFSGTDSNKFRLWFCHGWDYNPDEGVHCVDRAGSTLFENKEYSIVFWTKHRGTGFTLHKFATPKGSRNWYRLSVTGAEEVLGSLGNNYFWHAKHSASKSNLLFRFSDSPMNCGEKYL